MKKGVLIVSFGTSYREAEAQNINPVEQAISAALPGYEMRRAYGSRRIIKKLKERDGICIDTVSEALETLAVAGCKELIVQPTYVIHGYEYDELVEILREYLNQFESVRLGHPLLHQQSDYKELICGLNEVFDFRSSSDAFVFMGTWHRTFCQCMLSGTGASDSSSGIYKCVDRYRGRISGDYGCKGKTGTTVLPKSRIGTIDAGGGRSCQK